MNQSQFNDITGDNDSIRRMIDNLVKYSLPIIILLGTVGNFLSFAVLLRRSMRSTPMYFYLTLLAVSDTLVLYTSAFKTWIRLMTGKEALHHSRFVCKLLIYLMLDSLHLSAWLIVLVTVDRFIVVWFPFRGYLMMRIRQARAVAAVFLVIISLANAHAFWTFDLYTEVKEGSTSIQCDGLLDNFFMDRVFEHLKLTTYCIVPFLIVLTLNISIVLRLRQTSDILQSTEMTTSNEVGKNASRKNRMLLIHRQTAVTVVKTNERLLSKSSSLSSNHEVQQIVSPGYIKVDANRLYRDGSNVSNRSSRQPSTKWCDASRTRQIPGHATTDGGVGIGHVQSSKEVVSGRQRRLTRMLLFVSFAWLMTAPFALHPELVTPKTIPEPTKRQFIKTICFLLVYVNHSTHFYLYCVTGNRFRHELRAMFYRLGRLILAGLRYLTGCNRKEHGFQQQQRQSSPPAGSREGESKHDHPAGCEVRMHETGNGDNEQLNLAALSAGRNHEQDRVDEQLELVILSATGDN